MTKQEVLNIDTNTALMSINQLKESIKKLKEELGQLKIGSQQYEQKSKELITALNNLKKANDLTKASMDNFGNSIAGMQVRLTNVRRELYQMSTTDPGFKQKAKEVEQLANALNRAKITAGDYKNNIGNYKSGFDAFGGIMKGGAGALLGFTTAAGAAAAAIGLFAKGVSHMIDVNKSFEQENANLAAILGTTSDKITDLTESARSLGNATLYTAQEVTQLQTTLAKLGFEDYQILNMQASVLNFATAVGTDLASAAELAGASLRSFGLDSTEADKILNQLALSTTTSALSFDKLATAMPIVAPVAHQLGFELSDTVSLLAKLADTGMDASTAATSVRNIMLFLADSGSNLSKALGHSVSNLDEFAVALKEIKEQGLGLGEIFDLADKRSVAALSTLIEQTDALIDYKEELENAGLAIDKMADTRMNTLSGATTQLKSAWDDLMLSFSNTNGILASASRGLTTFINNVREAIDGVYKTSERNASKYVQDSIKEVIEVEEYLNHKGETKTREVTRADEWTKNYNKMLEAAGGNIADITSGDAEAIQRLQDAANKVKTDAEAKLKDYRAQLDDVNKELEEVGKNVDRSSKLSTVLKFAGTEGKVLAKATEFLTKSNKEDAAALEERKKQLSLLIAEQQRYADGQKQLQNTLDTQNKRDNNKKGDGKLDKSEIANLRAMYEAKMQYDITQKKKEKQNEIDFENDRYDIQKSYFDKILKLYEVNSTEYYHMQVKIEQLEQSHQDNLRKIKDAEFKADAEQQILEYTKLNAGMVISDQELADETLRIQKESIAKRKELYSENSKEYQKLLQEEAQLERKREKERDIANQRLIKQGDKSYESLKKQLRELAQFNMSDWAKVSAKYFDQMAKITDNFNKANGALELKRTESIKAIDESEILSAQQKADMKLQIEEAYLTASNALYQDYLNAQDELDRQHTELKMRAREDEIVRGAKVAIDVMDTFNTSLQDGTLSAISTGLTNIVNLSIDTFALLGPTLDALDKSFEDIGISMTTQQKSLVKIGALAGTVFSAMGSMLSGIADAQDTSSREGFESAKKMNIAAATMSMISGVINALAGIPSYIEMFKALGIGAPAAGIALGSTMAAMVAGLGAANIAKIASQKFDGGTTNASANAGALNYILPPVLYSSNVEGASTTDDVDQNLYVVSVTEFENVKSRVKVAEGEAKF